MRRRQFVAAGCCSVCGRSAGCLTEDDSGPVSEVGLLEIRNDQWDRGHEFLVQIEREAETVFEETHQLEAADSGESGVVLEDPVEPGALTVRVAVADHSVTVNTHDLVTDDRTCIRLQFCLGSETLHSEYQLYNRCE